MTDSDRLLTSSDERYYGSSERSPKDQLLGVSSNVQTGVYTRRWYIIAIFVTLTLIQSSAWNAWGPIGNSAKMVFGWTDQQIGMFPNWGNIAYMLSAFAAGWVLDVKGLRVGVVGCATLVTVATGLRCIPASDDLYNWIVNLSCFLNGMAGTIVLSGPPVLSATWFPVHQRTTATAIGAVFSYFGTAMSFLIGPMIVKEHTYFPELHNATVISNVTSVRPSLPGTSNSSNSTDPPSDPLQLAEQKQEIRKVMFIELGCAAFLLLVLLIYFPAQPPKPPSQSAATKRYEFKNGVSKLLRNRQFWYILIAYSMPTGIFNTWSTVLDANLEPVGISQDDAAMLGFYATIGGAISGLGASWFSDRIKGRMKLIIFMLLLGALLSVVWFCLLCAQYITLNMAQLYISSILAGVFINGTVPLFFELTVEACYPVAEGITCGTLTLFNSISGSLFLFILFDRSIGTSWMNWVLLGSVVISFPFLMLFNERHIRSAIDTPIGPTDLYVEPSISQHSGTVHPVT